MIPKQEGKSNAGNTACMFDFPLIDFHTHILPAMDDGSRSLDESLQMLYSLSESGVGKILLTPHFYADRENPETFFNRRSVAAEQLCCGLDASFRSTLYLGAEVAYYEGIAESEEIRRLCVEGTTCVLLEMPFHPWKETLFAEVAQLIRRGFTVVLAHVERYPDFRRRAVRKRLRESGALFQSNASRFLSKETSRRALRDFRSGEIDILASDCHRCDYRAPNLAEAAGYLVSVGEKLRLRETVHRASELLSGAKALILSNRLTPSDKDI